MKESQFLFIKISVIYVEKRLMKKQHNIPI